MTAPLFTAIAEIKKLHSARIMPDGLMLCDVCCFDQYGLQSDDCIGSHEHDSTPTVCSTMEIIARYSL